MTLLALLCVLPLAAGDRYFGEPVQLAGRAVYFTSWKYVRQGSFTWRVQVDENATEAERNIGAWLKGDGKRPAVFETIDMPRGIRLVAQPAVKVPFQGDRLAAQVFDDGKYKAWYVMDPCADPEPHSSKDKILPGHNGHVAYAESVDGVNWTRPNLGLYEYAGSRDNSIVWRGDLNGSTRGFHGGSVFIDPCSTDERFKMVYLGLLTEEEWSAFEAEYPGEADTMARRPDIGGTAHDPACRYAEHLLLRRGPKTLCGLRARVAGEPACGRYSTAGLHHLDHRGAALDRPVGEPGLPAFQPAGNRRQ
ncbi:MAG: hypothetical protein MUF48_25395, partial [Pirellulaceae bacterium]|nr:hypothetical protein [Pirellulaceae bacterium]